VARRRARAYAREEGFSLSAGGGGGGGATVDAAALESSSRRYFGVGGAFLESLRFAEAALGRDVWAELEVKRRKWTDPPSEESERLARYDAEHGEGYDKPIRPAFASEKAVVFSGAWAWARREALALYHDGCARGESDAARPARDRGRIARGADEAAVPARWGSWSAARAARATRATAEVFARAGRRHRPRAHPLPAERGRAPGPRRGGAARRPPRSSPSAAR
jgi:fatty acid synthase